MKKIVCVFILMFVVNSFVVAQIYVDDNGNVYDNRQSVRQVAKETKEESVNSGFRFDRSKLVFGGNFGVQFGDFTVVNISPQVGYNFSKYFTAGAGIGYTYNKDKFWNNGTQYRYSASYTGMNIFGRFYPIEYVVVSLQPEGNRMWKSVKYNGNRYSDNKFVGSVLVGGGIRYGGIMAMIQYDLVQNDDSPYGNKIFYSLGYTFSF